MNAKMKQKLQMLDDICMKYENSIPVQVVADYVGCTPAALRNSMLAQTCPFGYAWRTGARAGFCIPTIRFYNWIIGK